MNKESRGAPIVENADKYTSHSPCKEPKCGSCKCGHCGKSRRLCPCKPYEKNDPILKVCSACGVERTLGELFNGFLVTRSRLNEYQGDAAPLYISLCDECYVTKHGENSEYMEKGGAWKKEIARLTTEVSKLIEMNVFLCEEMTKQRETYRASMESVNEEITLLREELKRKRADETDVILKGTSDDNLVITNVNTCSVCDIAKSLSSFEEKRKKKNKEGPCGEYKIIRSVCKACRSAKYKGTKKAKTI